MRKRRVPLVVAVVRPVANRLERIEAMLMEMRFEQDLQTKRVTALREQFDQFVEHAVHRSRPKRRAK